MDNKDPCGTVAKRSAPAPGRSNVGRPSVAGLGAARASDVAAPEDGRTPWRPLAAFLPATPPAALSAILQSPQYGGIFLEVLTPLAGLVMEETPKCSTIWKAATSTRSLVRGCGSENV
jgi:hypothetical protein